MSLFLPTWRKANTVKMSLLGRLGLGKRRDSGAPQKDGPTSDKKGSNDKNTTKESPVASTNTVQEVSSPTQPIPTNGGSSASLTGSGSNNSGSSNSLDKLQFAAVNVKAIISKSLKSIKEICDEYGEFLTADETTTKLKVSKLSKSEVKKHVDLIIGRRDEWSSESEEVFAFRYNIRKAHVISENKSIERSDLLPPVYLTSDTTFDSSVKFFCKVNLVGGM